VGGGGHREVNSSLIAFIYITLILIILQSILLN
jgi:hypothetical protein